MDREPLEQLLRPARQHGSTKIACFSTTWDARLERGGRESRWRRAPRRVVAVATSGRSGGGSFHATLVAYM